MNKYLLIASNNIATYVNADTFIVRDGCAFFYVNEEMIGYAVAPIEVLKMQDGVIDSRTLQ